MEVEFVKKLVERYSSEVDFIDVRIQKSNGMILGTENGKLKRVQHFMGIGMGVRLLKNGCWGVGATDTLDRASMENAFRKAMSMVSVLAHKSPSKVKLSEEKVYEDECEYKVKIPFEDIPFEEKKKLILDIDKEMRKTDTRIIGSCLLYTSPSPRDRG
mgnify:CR=1 FL=1